MKIRLATVIIMLLVMYCPIDATAESTNPTSENWLYFVTDFFKPGSEKPVAPQTQLDVDVEYSKERITDNQYRAKLNTVTTTDNETSVNQYIKLGVDGEVGFLKNPEVHFIETLEGHKTIKSK